MKEEINLLKEKLNNSDEKNIELNNKITSLELENKEMKQKLNVIGNNIPFLEDLKIKISPLFCDYPFQDDILNHSTSIIWDLLFHLEKLKHL